MSQRVNVEDLIDTLEVAEILGLSRPNSVTTYLARYPDMPRPVLVKGNNRVRLWLRQDVEAWERDRRH